MVVRTFYNQKLIKSGDVFEVFEYEKYIKCGESHNVQGRRCEASESDQKEHRKKTLSKAKTTIRRLINANVNAWGEKPKFLTLTFADNVQDIKTANYEFKKFRQRIEYKLKIKLKYVVVVEFQKRGAIHYHAIFFNLPYIAAELLASIWANGFIRVNRIDEVDNVGAYVTKYMTKQEYSEEKTDRLKGQKSYFTSRGLKQPEIIYDEKEIEQVRTALSRHQVYNSLFENDYLGMIKYTQYNMKR